MLSAEMAHNNNAIRPKIPLLLFCLSFSLFLYAFSFVSFCSAAIFVSFGTNKQKKLDENVNIFEKENGQIENKRKY